MVQLKNLYVPAGGGVSSAHLPRSLRSEEKRKKDAGDCLRSKSELQRTCSSVADEQLSVTTFRRDKLSRRNATPKQLRNPANCAPKLPPEVPNSRYVYGITPCTYAMELQQDVAALQQLVAQPQQLMLAGTLQRARALGGQLLQRESPRGRRGLFRRGSSLRKKPKKPPLKARSAPAALQLLGDDADRSPQAAATRFHQAAQSCAELATTFAKTSKFVFHVASVRRMHADLHAVGRQLALVAALVDAAELQPSGGTSWAQQLQDDRGQEEAQLGARAAKNALPFARDMRPHEPMEALTLLKYEIDFFKAENSARHVATMKKVFFSVVRSSNGRVAKIPDWYIPPNAVHYNRTPMRGSVGTAHRGVRVEWKPAERTQPAREGGQRQPERVVVKRLFIHADAIEMFRQEVELWFSLDHPSILKLYGASHCSRPALLVLEDAENGPLVNYLHYHRQLHADKRRWLKETDLRVYQSLQHALWSLLLQAANGLKYLHTEKKLVHSNLKSDNILVTADGSVKLTDFGLGMLALQNQAIEEVCFRELGWRAPNCQRESRFRRPSFQDDIYSFGLCVLDVLVPELSSISKKENSPPCEPKHVGDEGFDPLATNVLSRIKNDTHKDLVRGMCQKKPEDRWSLNIVIERMEEMCTAASREQECSIQ
ncbi:unnamed protein product [Phytophthora fragariaefolia]|uniref:Unnamed protein product n=1 Tax=Phytophthora fragariaefolia TaxID=1490495 RepID=A0A9W6Y518_9STRA|nr:unnamed protein product [Phytophthora fragariaefolia]